MTIIHKGVRRKVSDVNDDYGMAYYCQNWRFKRAGEIGRRPGIGKSNMARLTGPVRSMLCGGLYFPYLVQLNNAGDVEATLSPEAKWSDPVMAIPDGGAGEAQAPTILSITPSPASGSPYIVGQVTFTAVVAYDNLSGPLVYLWSGNNGGPSTAQPISVGSNPGIFDFDATCISGNYTGFSLNVSTTNNPLLFDFSFFDYEVG